MPIQSYRWLDAIGARCAHAGYLVEEAGITYIDEYASDDAEEDEPALSNGAVELRRPGAQTYVTSPCRAGTRNVLHFNTIRSEAGRDAINSLVVALGSELSRTNVDAGTGRSGQRFRDARPVLR